MEDPLEPHEQEDLKNLLELIHLQPLEVKDDNDLPNNRHISSKHTGDRTQDDFTDELVASYNGLETHLTPRTRKSSLASSLLTEIEEDELMIDVDSSKPSKNLSPVSLEITLF